MRLMSQIVNEMPPPLRVHLPQAPEALENLMNRMMAKQPDDRLGTAVEFADALTAIRSGQPAGHAPQKMTDATDGTLVSAVITLLSSVTTLRPSMLRPPDNKQPVASPAEAGTNRPRGLLIVALLGLVLLVSGIGYWLSQPKRSSGEIGDGKSDQNSQLCRTRLLKRFPYRGCRYRTFPRRGYPKIRKLVFHLLCHLPKVHRYGQSDP